MDTCPLCEVCRMGSFTKRVRIITRPPQDACQERHHVGMIAIFRLQAHKGAGLFEVIVLGPGRQWLLDRANLREYSARCIINN